MILLLLIAIPCITMIGYNVMEALEYHKIKHIQINQIIKYNYKIFYKT